MAPSLEIDDLPVNETVLSYTKSPATEFVEKLQTQPTHGTKRPAAEVVEEIQVKRRSPEHQVPPQVPAEIDDGSSLLDFKIDHDPFRVLHHSVVPDDFDPLRFEAAASRQLRAPVHEADVSPWLVSSPYNSAPHLLDLRRLDMQNALFAKALTVLQPTRPDYATADYTASLNLDFVLSTLRDLCKLANWNWQQQEFYVVIFRSKLKADIDNDLLYKLDAMSHQEATSSGGLLKYWFGKSDSENQNLATCFWRNREDARLGGRGPWHVKARRAGKTMYEHIKFSTHKFTVSDDALTYSMDDFIQGSHHF